MAHALKSMELSDDEKHDFRSPIEMSAPEFPYGLHICLGDAEIEKLGIDPEKMTIDASLMAHCLIRITSINCDKRDDGDHYRIEGQIEQMAVDGDEDAEEKPARRIKYNMGSLAR